MFNVFKKRLGLVELPTQESVIAKVFGGSEAGTGGTAADPNVPATGGGANPPATGGTAGDEPVHSEGSPAGAEGASGAAAAAPEATPPAEKKPDPQAARFAALARKDKQVREREMAMERRQAEIEAREKTIKEAEGKKFTSPLDLLKAHNYSLEDANLAALGRHNEKPKDPVDEKVRGAMTPLEAQLKQQNDLIAAMKQNLEALQLDRAQTAAREVRREIIDIAAKEGFDTIPAIGDEAYALIEQVRAEYFQEHRKLLSYKEACGTVDTFYRDRLKSIIDASPKLKEMFSPAAAAPAATKQPASKEEKKERPNTLTQAHGNVSPSAKVDTNKMSKEEFIAHAAARLQFR